MTETNIRLEIPESVMKELEEKLDGIKNPNAVVKSAVNYTADRLRRELARKVQTVYRYQGGKAAVLAASSLKKAYVKEPAVDIKFESRTFGIEQFYIASNIKNRGPVYGAVMKKEKPQILRKETGLAFVVRFANGHMGVAYRATQKDSHPDKAKKPRYGKPGGKPYKYNQHTATLKSMHSPAIPSMVKSEKVYGALQDKYQQILERQIRKVMEKAING